jgi:hypothetical protein
MDVHEKVRARASAFDAALPALLKSRLKGRWVIFLNGQVEADFARGRGPRRRRRRFGYDGGFVVTRSSPSGSSGSPALRCSS